MAVGTLEREPELIAAEKALVARTPAVSVAPVVTPAEFDLVTRTVAAGATPDELKLYLFDCARQGVHPLDKRFTSRRTDKRGSGTPVTSIDFMRVRAAETGEMAGSDDPVFDVHPNGQVVEPLAASVTVYRLTQGQRFPYTATARWSEYKPVDDFMWRKMPHTMLGKCAEALALRKGFPRQLAGLYAAEEMAQAQSYPVEAPTPQASAAPADQGERETRPAATGGEPRPSSPPPGYVVIDRYQFKNGWHDVHVGQTRYSTKTAVGHLAKEAFDAGWPVKLDSVVKPGVNPKGEHWLNGVEKWSGSDAPPF